MRLYCGIDLHSNNSYLVVLDQDDGVVYRRRVRNDLQLILQELSPFAGQLVGIVVESTFNWYWLVDGLIEAGYRVHLANPNAMRQYDGLKFADDRSDARWLAHLLRIGVLSTGYIYPRELRSLRDLLRKRGRLVHPYLAWAFIEAAHFAIRFHSPVRRFYERKQARTHRVVALKAVAHKLARASYYVMRDQLPFQIGLAFG